MMSAIAGSENSGKRGKERCRVVPVVGRERPFRADRQMSTVRSVSSLVLRLFSLSLFVLFRFSFLPLTTPHICLLGIHQVYLSSTITNYSSVWITQIATDIKPALTIDAFTLHHHFLAATSPLDGENKFRRQKKPDDALLSLNAVINGLDPAGENAILKPARDAFYPPSVLLATTRVCFFFAHVRRLLADVRSAP